MTSRVFSEEQCNIARHILANKNVVVDAVAGSGKTTTIELIAQHYPSSITVLMYNKSLADESRPKLLRSNIIVGTLHSFAQRIYGIQCNTNWGLNHILQNNLRPKCSNFMQGLLVLDETQDFKALLYQLTIKLICDNNNPSLRVLVLGDVYQCIYKFMDANPEYLSRANEYFQRYIAGEWVFSTLSTSYRLTKQMADFVNTVMIKKHRIISTREGAKVIYITDNLFSEDFRAHIARIIKSVVGTQYDDVAILAKSVKGTKTSPMSLLENYLKAHLPGCNIYCPHQDDVELDPELIRNKLVFSTIHSFKGRQRELIIFMGFDDYYYNNNEINKHSMPYHKCPETLYVAGTRASHTFVACHSSKNAFLPFLNTEKIREICDVRGILSEVPQKDRSKKEKTFTVSEICGYISFPDTMKLFSYITQEKIAVGGALMIPKGVATFDTTSEQISHLYGTIIPGIAEKILYNREPTYVQKIKEYVPKSKNRLHTELEQCKMWINKQKSFQDYAQLANIYNSTCTGFCSNLDQISNYEWTDENSIKELSQRIANKLETKDDPYIFEDSVSYEGTCGDVAIYIVGNIDTHNSTDLYEFKCSSAQKDEHIIQAVIYACLYYFEKKKVLNIKLYYPTLDIMNNIKIINISENAQKIIDILVDSKIHNNQFGKIIPLPDMVLPPPLPDMVLPPPLPDMVLPPPLPDILVSV